MTSMDLPARLLWLRRLGLTCVVLVVLVMGLGSWVKANGAGLSCPDWPTCYGEWVPPFPSMETEGQFAGIQGPAVDGAEAYTEAQILYEWAHRAVVGVLVVPLVAFAILGLTTREATTSLRRLPLAALLLYFSQAALGALTVVTGNPPWATTLHLVTATLLLLLLTVATCIATLRPLPLQTPKEPPKPAKMLTVPAERRIEFTYKEEAPANDGQ